MKLARPPFLTPSPNHSMTSISAPPVRESVVLSEIAGCIHSEACCPWSSWNLIRAASTPNRKKWPLVMMCPLRR